MDMIKLVHYEARTVGKRAVGIPLKCLFTGCNEVVAKVIFLHLVVILFTWGGLPQCMLGCHTPTGSRHTPPRADTPPEQTPPWEQTHTPGSRPPRRSRLQHTVYEQPVHILLECILVFFENSSDTEYRSSST